MEEPVTPIEGYPGRVAAARMRAPDSQTLLLASVHAPVVKNYVFPTLEVTFHDLEARFGQERVVIGGDLNSARHADRVWPEGGHGPFWSSIDEGARAFVDCHFSRKRREVKTFFRAGTVNDFQDDHMFASRDIDARVMRCEVLGAIAARRWSDHAPVVMEIEFSP